VIHIHFGLNCDGSKLPEASCGEIVGGEITMLAILETQLGIHHQEAGFTHRLVEFLGCLESTLTPDRFYTRSFEADAFATASTLLQWRDQLYMAGWNGRFEQDVPLRLRDLADIEVEAKALVPANTGQRLQHIIERLDQQTTQIKTIQLIDELELLPPLWQQLLCLLRDLHKVDLLAPLQLLPAAPVDTDLGKLQRALLTDSSDNKVTLTNDGSLLPLTAPSAAISAVATAQMFHSYQSQSGEALRATIVAEHNGTSLDSSFEALDLPRPGFSNQSVWRPAFQVLALAFEIMWKPLEPKVWLQFLTHPVGPLSKRLKSELADLVSIAPGMGSSDWHRIIADHLEEQEESITTPEDRKRYKNKELAIGQWLRAPTYDPEGGMPCNTAITRAELVSSWLSYQHSLLKAERDESEGLFALAYSQAEDLLSILRKLKVSGRESITREALRLLIDQVRGSGMGLVDRSAETTLAGNPVEAVENPAAVLCKQPVVLWWGLKYAATGQRSPWLPAERKALAFSNVSLWDKAHELSLLANSWLRPLLAASEQLILLQHKNSDRHHQVLDLVAAKLEQGLDQLEPLSIIDFLTQGQPLSVAGVEQCCTSAPLTPIDLPVKRRWWHLDGVELPKREVESYSSLDKFINSPYQWVLNYQARLRAGSIAQVQDEFRLKGNLAHTLIEDFFNAHRSISSIALSDIDVWCREHFQTLLPTSGATLLLPGLRPERERFIDQCCTGLKELCHHLQSASVVSVTMEANQKGAFRGGQITGSIDVLAINDRGQEAVIDIKWAGYKGRRKKWSEGDYMQLATYAHLRKQATGSLPALGYFFIQDMKLLANDSDFFCSGELLESHDKLTLTQYWADIEDTWTWRREQMDTGLIEVSIKGTEQTDESQPEKGLVIPEASDQYSEFATLTGWEEGQ